jgi:hypothetical protein
MNKIPGDELQSEENPIVDLGEISFEVLKPKGKVSVSKDDLNKNDGRQYEYIAERLRNGGLPAQSMAREHLQLALMQVGANSFDQEEEEESFIFKWG